MSENNVIAIIHAAATLAEAIIHAVYSSNNSLPG